ncbi:hypothetical protein CBR_g4274 [Chara braunii]|uniref:Uncharacterized protein n=1 Tax=Chara braunii TaxID=69332 RepID=A0A388JRB8_CHABU|nr:hypothetical protein CBR_g4274 [Chara braunii]|eukprot:GBG60318.1 hypothetical protein CBR_g4274 [Chara braunii]
MKHDAARETAGEMGEVTARERRNSAAREKEERFGEKNGRENRAEMVARASKKAYSGAQGKEEKKKKKKKEKEKEKKKKKKRKKKKEKEEEGDEGKGDLPVDGPARWKARLCLSRPTMIGCAP